MRFGEPVVDREGVSERLHGRGRMPVAIPRHRQLVQHTRRAVVDRHEAQVVFRRALEPVHRQVHVAEKLFGPRRRRVDRRRASEVAKGGREIPGPTVRVAALQIPEHRIGPERNGPAERLDGERSLVPRKRAVPEGDQPAELALLPNPVPGYDRRHQGGGEQQDEGPNSCHRLTARGLWLRGLEPSRPSAISLKPQAQRGDSNREPGGGRGV
jgi:hypothetical protein